MAEGNAVVQQNLNADGRTPLTAAIAANDTELAVGLIAAGANVNAADGKKFTPLTLAARTGQVEIVRALLESRADPNLLTPKPGEFTPLYFAVESQNPEIVRMLLVAGANPTKVVKGKGPPIVYASAKGNVDIVNQLLALQKKGKKVVDVNKATVNNLTPLMAACDSPNSSLAVVEALLAAGAGAGVNEKYKDRHTPLWLAALVNHPNYVGPLAAAGADVNARLMPTGDTPLVWAVTHSRPVLVNALIAAGADVNMGDLLNRAPPLILAIESDQTAIATALINAGADLNVTRPGSYTALQNAIRRKNLPIVQRILAVPGLDVNRVTMLPAVGTRPAGGTTALMEAVGTKGGSMAIVAALLAHGVDVNLAPPPSQFTPVMYASFYGHLDALNALIAAGGDVNRETTGHATALYYAALEGKAELVNILLAAGADVRKGSINGRTVLEQAEAGVYNDEINDAIIAAAGPAAPPALWKGFTKGDMEKFDMIFSTEPEGGFAHPPANNYFTCPVCMTYGERATACNYMKHNCTLQTPFYHRELYQKYKNKDGEVGWCCICGRVCTGHTHLKLVPYDAPNSGGVTDARGVVIQGDPYEVDCRTSSGGGGLPEKLARFRALRETASLLQAEVDSMPEREARKILIEETWNGPFTKAFVTRRIKGAANWNTPLTAFRAEAATGNAGPAPNIPLPANRAPAELVEGEFMDDVTLDDFTRGVKYTHVQPNGSTQEHTSSIRGLISYVITQIGQPHSDEFARCAWYLVGGGGCNCYIYPEEIRPFIGQEAEDDVEGQPKTFTQELFDQYAAKFNEKFRGGVPLAGGRRHRHRRLTRKAGGQLRQTRHQQKQQHQRGGADRLPVFIPMKDAMCVVPPRPTKPMKGGRRRVTRSHHKKSRHGQSHRRRITRRKGQTRT